MGRRLRVVLIKPSKYGVDGFVERFRWGFMPNSTVPYMRSMTPAAIADTLLEIHTVDEYVFTDTDYLSLLERRDGVPTLVAFVGVQSHQLHRAIDLAAYASTKGCMTILGGPHAMTCDTAMLQGRGVSFALSEAELIWDEILQDALGGELKPVYGGHQRWQQELDAPVIVPPTRRELRRYVVPMLGLYPARGCPFSCSFCSVIKISGRRIRSQSIDTTLRSLRAAKDAGIRLIMFTSDNFNKYSEATELLNAMIEERLNLMFFVQCDAQIGRQEELVALLARAGCFQMFVGIESFNRETLLAAKKRQNRPELYAEIVELCRKYGIISHFSNIIGFPQDEEADIRTHLETLRGIGPTWASFYILCPIPGTEQYADFLTQGLITERNLDRFDTTCLTWAHPHLSPERLKTLLYACYGHFYSLRHTNRERLFASLPSFAFHRFCAYRQVHPMSGGIRRIRLDRASDFLTFRKQVFGFELAPLPTNLALPETDREINLRLNPNATVLGSGQHWNKKSE